MAQAAEAIVIQFSSDWHDFRGSGKKLLNGVGMIHPTRDHGVLQIAVARWAIRLELNIVRP